jgi:hypothetical protein
MGGMTPEILVDNFVSPSASREAAIAFVRNYGRESDPSRPTQAVPLKAIIAQELLRNWWFGPDVDVINFLYAKQVLGIFKIDSAAKEETITWVGENL